jgi:putative ABC transport system ATP-binding protein
MSIKIDKLRLQFQDKELFCVSHEFAKQQIHLIKGASGCGKSSLLRLIAGLSPAHSGKILINDAPILDQQKHRLQCQYLFQQAVIFPGTVRENLLYPFEFNDLNPPSDLKDQVNNIFPEKISLDQDAKVLSVGQKQRLALLRALLIKPEYLLCDEVTSGLDESSRKITEELIIEFCTHGGTVIFITHVDSSFVDFENRIELEMNDGILRRAL